MSISKQTFRSGPYKDFFAQGVKVGNILYIAGQVGVDEEGNVPEDVAAQTELAYAHMKAVLSEFGATMENVVDETFFVTNMSEIMENAEAVFGVRAQAYGGIPEVSQTLIQVAGLVAPEMKLEIKCIAHL